MFSSHVCKQTNVDSLIVVVRKLLGCVCLFPPCEVDFFYFLWLVPDREICVNFWCSEDGNFPFSVIFCPQFLSNKFNFFLLRILLFIIIISLFTGTVNMKLLGERRVFIHVKETFLGERLLIQMLIAKIGSKTKIRATT